VNTRIRYEYRDGANYHFQGEVVVAGRMTPALWKRLRAACSADADHGFIAHQVGLTEVFGYLPGPHITWLPAGEAPEYDEENDHCWHRLPEEPNAWELTTDSPTDTRCVEELVDQFECASKAGWRVFDPAERFEF
jgi:hypothetical protein